MIDRSREYLAIKGRKFFDKYDGNSKGMAWHLAWELLNELKKPWIAEVRSLDGPLVPTRYGGRIELTDHIVCCVGDEVYEPIMGDVFSIQRYKDLVFDGEIELVELYPKDKIRDFLCK